jgi:hypothetical protein
MGGGRGAAVVKNADSVFEARHVHLGPTEVFEAVFTLRVKALSVLRLSKALS